MEAERCYVASLAMEEGYYESRYVDSLQKLENAS